MMSFWTFRIALVLATDLACSESVLLRILFVQPYPIKVLKASELAFLPLSSTLSLPYCIVFQHASPESYEQLFIPICFITKLTSFRKI